MHADSLTPRRARHDLGPQRCSRSASEEGQDASGAQTARRRSVELLDGELEQAEVDVLVQRLQHAIRLMIDRESIVGLGQLRDDRDLVPERFVGGGASDPESWQHLQHEPVPERVLQIPQHVKCEPADSATHRVRTRGYRIA